MSDVPEEGRELTEQEAFEKSQLYIPEAKLDTNVKRMAWMLFLEMWKKHAAAGTAMMNVDAQYMVAVEAAKVVWHEQEKGYERD